MNTTYAHAVSSRIAIEAGSAASIQVGVGAAIRCVSGSIWLTQEGDARDHWLVAGVSFCVDRGGRAVLGALDGPAAVIVEPAHSMAPGTLRIDSLEALTRRAREAQAQGVAYAFSKLWAGTLAILRRLRVPATAGKEV